MSIDKKIKSSAANQHTGGVAAGTPAAGCVSPCGVDASSDAEAMNRAMIGLAAASPAELLQTLGELLDRIFKTDVPGQTSVSEPVAELEPEPQPAAAADGTRSGIVLAPRPMRARELRRSAGVRRRSRVRSTRGVRVRLPARDDRVCAIQKLPKIMTMTIHLRYL